MEYRLDTAELQRELNKAKELVLITLEDAGVIADADALAARYTVIVGEPSTLGRLWDKLRGRETPDNGRGHYYVLRATDDARIVETEQPEGKTE